MRITYVSTDEVNQDLAARIAAKFGVGVCKRLPKDRMPDDLCDAVLYNLDDVPRAEQPAFLEWHCLGIADCPTAVHGYCITDEQAEALGRHGVAVADRLHPALLHSLCKAARRSRATVPPQDARTDLTWVDLAK